MTLAELYEQQQRELEDFKTTRDKAWANLQEQQQGLTAAFGSKENLPDDMRKRMDEQIENYRKDWSMDTGQHHQALMQKHNEQREAISPSQPRKENEPALTAKNDNDAITEKQIKLQKIIKQQQAIKARSLQHKPKR